MHVFSSHTLPVHSNLPVSLKHHWCVGNGTRELALVNIAEDQFTTVTSTGIASEETGDDCELSLSVKRRTD